MEDGNRNWVVVSNIFYFHPYLGKIPRLTNIFQLGWNHQLGNDLDSQHPAEFIQQKRTPEFLGKKNPDLAERLYLFFWAGKLVRTYWVHTPLSNSHHQDHYIISRESLLTIINLHLPLESWVGGQPNVHLSISVQFFFMTFPRTNTKRKRHKFIPATLEQQKLTRPLIQGEG